MKTSARQVAALPLTRDSKGRLRVLMVTSRDTGRWVMPKGWEMRGREPWKAAEIEAMEEAGVAGRIAREPIGSFTYAKRLDDGTELPTTVTLYPMMVTKLKRRWKERDERKRRWFSPKGAARAVDEPDLEAVLRELGRRSGWRPVERLLKAS